MSTLDEAVITGYLITFPIFTTKQLRNHPPHSKATDTEHMHAIKGNRKRVPVKFLLASSISKTPTPSQETQTHLIENNEEHLTKIHNSLSKQDIIIQPEASPTPTAPITPPPTVQSLACVQQTTTI